MALLEALRKAQQLLESWSADIGQEECIPILNGLAALVEEATVDYCRRDPDPFDDRHPVRADPDSTLGHLYNSLHKNTEFLRKVVNECLCSSNSKSVEEAAARLLYSILPSLDASVVFQQSGDLVRKLFTLAESPEDEPLRWHAIGLLAAAMEVQDLAVEYKDSNSALIPVVIRTLYKLYDQMIEESEQTVSSTEKVRHFAVFAKSSSNDVVDQPTSNNAGSILPSPPNKRLRLESDGEASSSFIDFERFVIGNVSLYPLTTALKQRLLLQYLTPMGEYQEVLTSVFDLNVLTLVLRYIDLEVNPDVRLAFDALKFLASLLCHKKFAADFISSGGVQALLNVRRPSVAATGVSICFYYLAYFEDVMERVCLLPQSVLAQLMRYALWLLECSHISGRCHATLFVASVVHFPGMLRLFDQMDGLRKLFNIVSTLDIVRVGDSEEVGEEDAFTQKQTCRQVVNALKQYFRAHLIAKSTEVQSRHSRPNWSGPSQASKAKAVKPTWEEVEKSVELLTQLLPANSIWGPVHAFLQLDGIQLMLQIVALAINWGNFNGRSETCRSALDVLYLNSSWRRIQLEFTKSVKVSDATSTPAVSILLGVAEGENAPDPEVQKAALRVLVNCTCGPLDRYSVALKRVSLPSLQDEHPTKEDILSKIWKEIRVSNGIMVLLRLIGKKSPIADADAIRALASQCLDGLARSEEVQQIISKMPLFTAGQIQLLMREPVLHDKLVEHNRFCLHATRLMERTGTKPAPLLDASLDRIRRADIVARSRIVYKEKDLLQLIHDHLQAKGLSESASVLLREAELVRSVSPPPLAGLPATPNFFSPAARSQRNSTASFTPAPSRSVLTPARTPLFTDAQPPTSSAPEEASGGGSQGNAGLQAPIRFQLRSAQSPAVTQQQQAQRVFGSSYRPKLGRSRSDLATSSSSSVVQQTRAGALDEPVSLDKIVKDYLLQQHLSCPNPVLTCPTMSLFEPHRCPEAHRKSAVPLNTTARLAGRPMASKTASMQGTRLNRRFIHSRFRPGSILRDLGEGANFSACCFYEPRAALLLGCYSGDVKLYSTANEEEMLSFSCHGSHITNIQHSGGTMGSGCDSCLLLTSCSWGAPQSVLWTMYEDRVDLKFGFDVENHAEFGKLSYERIITTNKEKAKLYDTATCTCIRMFYDSDQSNLYSHNRATLHPSDTLVLNDGVLWDVRSPELIHKFDKFNPAISGVFHPAGQEIIINTEVWDMRSYRLLHTVSGLDQCRIRFTHNGNVLYAAACAEVEDEEEERKNQFSSFRTFDGVDYTSISTFALKKDILDIQLTKSDCFVGVVERQYFDEFGEESSCRLYTVGAVMTEEEEQQEEDTEDEGMQEDSDDSDDDDDDPDIDMQLIEDDENEGGDQEEENQEGNENGVEGGAEENADEQDENEEDEEEDDGDDDDDDDDEDIEVIDMDDDSDGDIEILFDSDEDSRFSLG